MDYGSLKEIVSIKSYNIIHELIGKPTVNLYTETATAISPTFDPYDDAPDNLEDVSTNGLTYITTIDAVYTYDKNLVSTAQGSLGSVYSLSVYLRFDDVPSNLLDNTISLVVEMSGVFYKVKSRANAYGIIYTLELEI